MKIFFKASSLLILVSSVMQISCNDSFLDKKPLDEVLSERYFENPSDLEIYMNQFYTADNLPKYENHGNDYDSDDMVGATVNLRLQGTRTVPSVGTIDFKQVRSLNYFLANYKRIEGRHDFKSYQQYVGEAYYFKAIVYFNLLKSYGDIQWLDKDLTTSSPELYEPRTPRAIVADRIIGCLDTAAMYLTPDRTNGYSRINKWIALLMKSRVALYEGTWQKYHKYTAGDESFGVANADWRKYLQQAVAASKLVMESGIYSVYSTGNTAEDYKNLFNRRDYAANSEVLFWRRYDNDLSRGNSAFTNDRNFRMSQPLGKSLSKQMVDSYLCTDGKAIDGNPLFQGYSDIAHEFTNRDPRLRQTVATRDQVWKIAKDGTTQNWSEIYNTLNTKTDLNAPTGYVIQKGYDPQVIYHVQQYEETPSILFRYAEVLLNYVEAKAVLEILDQADINLTVNLLRDRVGMPHLDIHNIATDSKWDFPTLSPVINEIRRERRVELVGEGFRWDDIARWAAAGELIEGKRPKGFLASQITKNPFPVDAAGFLDPFQNVLSKGYEFKNDRDYLNPIPENQLRLNKKLKQNPGWGPE